MLNQSSILSFWFYVFLQLFSNHENVHGVFLIDWKKKPKKNPLFKSSASKPTIVFGKTQSHIEKYSLKMLCFQ